MPNVTTSLEEIGSHLDAVNMMLLAFNYTRIALLK